MTPEDIKPLLLSIFESYRENPGQPYDYNTDDIWQYFAEGDNETSILQFKVAIDEAFNIYIGSSEWKELTTFANIIAHIWYKSLNRSECLPLIEAELRQHSASLNFYLFLAFELAGIALIIYLPWFYGLVIFIILVFSLRFHSKSDDKEQIIYLLNRKEKLIEVLGQDNQDN